MLNNTAQEIFDKHYITSHEIGAILDISRATIVLWKKNQLMPYLPHPIEIGGVGEGKRTSQTIWERETIEKILPELKNYLAQKRNGK